MTDDFDRYDDGSGLSGRHSPGRWSTTWIDGDEPADGKPHHGPKRRRFKRSDGWVPLDSSSRLPRRETGHVGWSLLIGAVSIAAVSGLAVVMGSTTIGMIATVGMVVSMWGLVLAELVARYGSGGSDSDA